MTERKGKKSDRDGEGHRGTEVDREKREITIIIWVATQWPIMSILNFVNN